MQTENSATVNTNTKAKSIKKTISKMQTKKETKPSETKPSETKPSETKPSETKEDEPQVSSVSIKSDPVVESSTKQVVLVKDKKDKQMDKIDEQQKAFDDLLNETTQILKDNINNQRMLLNQLNLIKQTHNKHIRILMKTSKLHNKKSVNEKKRNPAGFAKPAPISKELYIFFNTQLGQDKIKTILSKSSNNELYQTDNFMFGENTMISRTDATKLLSIYYNENDLFGLKKEDGTIDHRTIIPNIELRTLFNLNENDTFTYFNQQTLLKSHFPKQVPVISSS